MIIDMRDFEYQKENIQPIPEGRSAKILSALYAKDSIEDKNKDDSSPNTNDNNDDSDSLSGKEKREIRKKEFEEELKDIDEVDDPLNTYFNYIIFLRDNYPSGNDRETGLLSLLETVLKKYQGDPRYINDSRYLRLWFIYAHYSVEPVEIFKFLSVNEIGQNLSTYYEEYALLMETLNKYKEANEIYTLGINRKAQPIERLKKRYIEFQKRMVLSVNKQSDDTDSPKNTNKVKSSFLNLKSKNTSRRIPLQVKHVSSTAIPLSQNNDQNHDPNIDAGNNQNVSFSIFLDKENKDVDIKDELFGSHKDHENQKEIFSSDHSKHQSQGNLVLPTVDKTNEWRELGSRDLRKKENTKEILKWTSATIPQKEKLINRRMNNGSHRSPVSFKIYEDPIEPEKPNIINNIPTNKQDNNVNNQNIGNENNQNNSNEKPKNMEVHRCLMNMIYSLSINNLYKEILKEKERIKKRRRAGLKSERMNEYFTKLDEKTFNKIKKNIDWSYNPSQCEYYNSFECKNINEFSIEEIRAKYYEKGMARKTTRDEEVKGEEEEKVKRKILNEENEEKKMKLKADKMDSKIYSDNNSQSTSITNQPPLKKNKSISDLSSKIKLNTNDNENKNKNEIENKNKNESKNKIDFMYEYEYEIKNEIEFENISCENEDNKENRSDNKENINRENEEVLPSTIKKDFKSFIPRKRINNLNNTKDINKNNKNNNNNNNENSRKPKLFNPLNVSNSALNILHKPLRRSSIESSPISHQRQRLSPHRHRSPISPLKYTHNKIKTLNYNNKSPSRIRTPIKSQTPTKSLSKTPSKTQQSQTDVETKINSNTLISSSSSSSFEYSSSTPSKNKTLTKISMNTSNFNITSDYTTSTSATIPVDSTISTNTTVSLTTPIKMKYSESPITALTKTSSISDTNHSNSKASKSNYNSDPFSRCESFHCKNSPTVTICTKNACAAVYEWFNEPCDVETMDNLYMDRTMSSSDIDNTFFLRKQNQNKKKN